MSSYELSVKERGEIITRWIAGEAMQTCDHHLDRPWMDYPEFDGNNVPNSLRVRIKPTKRVAYMNVYSREVLAHETKAIADASAGRDRIACVRVEYEEGQFDE